MSVKRDIYRIGLCVTSVEWNPGFGGVLFQLIVGSGAKRVGTYKTKEQFN